MKNIRNLIVGMIAGALLATAGSAFAAPALQKVAALGRPDYSVKVDGKKVDMQHAPLTYGGTTYVPLREAGEILGYNVGFDSGTITLDSTSKGADTMSTTTDTTTTEPVSTDAPDAATLEASGDWVSLDTLKRKVEMAYGPVTNDDSGDKMGGNTLKIQANSKTVYILNVVNPDNAEKMTYDIYGGGTIDVLYIQGATLLDAKKLHDLGII